MEKKNKENKHLFQLMVAGAVTVAGVSLLIAGFIVAPKGEIHSSVLVAYGECMTFVGALVGIDYRYRGHE